MYKLSYKLSVRERVSAKCERHPGYNPEKHGRGGIKGGCSTCFNLYDLHMARVALDAAVHQFVRRAGPWSMPRESRRRKKGDSLSPAEIPEVTA